MRTSLAAVTALLGLQTRLRLARLYLCTDARSEQGDLADFCEAAFAGGVDVLQIRQKEMDPDAEMAALEVARAVASRRQGLVCVNDSPWLAARFGADVLHLGQTDGPSSAARREVGEPALLGRSTHSPQQADDAARDSAVNYFCVGPVFATATKPDDEPVGLELLNYAARLAPPSKPSAKPWFAIGGINLGNLDAVLAAGARRICVVRPITRAADPQAAAQALSDRLREAWRSEEMQRYALAAYR